MTTTQPSAFTALDDAFAALSVEPRSLAFDGREVPGLPDRAIPFTELRGLLLHPSTTYATRDAAMAVLVTNAKERGGAATIGLAGVLLPGLRRAAHPLVRSCPERAADVEADMLVALLSALARVSPRRHRLAGHLVGAAVTAAQRAVREELSEQGRLTHAAHAFPPHRPWGHPDLVLADAVLEGVISADDAELIGSTRLEDQNLKQAARVRGITHAAARHRRSRAERRLVEYLASGLVPPEEDATAETRSGTPRLGTKGLAISIPQVQNVRDREADPTGDPSRVGASSGTSEPRR
jgi:hypothetical protein